MMKTTAQSTLTAIFLLFAATAAHAQYLFVTNNGTITITKYTGFGGDVTIPDMINGRPVTAIAPSAFISCSTVTSVTIASSVTILGNSSFRDCANLTSVTIPASVTDIGSYAFGGCLRLRTIMIPESVTSIGTGPFQYSPGLTNITVQPLNSFYSSVDGVLFNKSQTTLLQCPGGILGAYAISNRVTSIADRAFGYCSGLTSVTIPSSVTNIGSYAFMYCPNLANVAFPNSIISIGNYAFRDCNSLTEVILPDSVTSLGTHAFFYCANLLSATIGNSVPAIGDKTFDHCSQLTSVIVGRSVTNLGAYSFWYCTNLTAVYFQGNRPTDGLDAFDGDLNAVIYYLPGTARWGSIFADCPTALWTPKVQTAGPTFGVRTNRFGFTITWASGQVVVIEASTSLANPTWSPLQTNTLAGDSCYFSDPNWTNHPARLYRIRSP